MSSLPDTFREVFRKRPHDAVRRRRDAAASQDASRRGWRRHEPRRHLVRALHPHHRGLPHPRRLRPGRRHPAPAARPDGRRAAHLPQQHRPGLGRQRGLAGARRRRPVRRLPAGLCVAVLGLLPRVHARAAWPHPARRSPSSSAARSRARRWRSGWDIVFAVASLGLALLLGVAFGNIVRGVPLDADGNITISLHRPAQPVRAARSASRPCMFALHGGSTC